MLDKERQIHLQCVAELDQVEAALHDWATQYPELFNLLGEATVALSHRLRERMRTLDAVSPAPSGAGVEHQLHMKLVDFAILSLTKMSLRLAEEANDDRGNKPD